MVQNNSALCETKMKHNSCKARFVEHQIKPNLSSDRSSNLKILSLLYFQQILIWTATEAWLAHVNDADCGFVSGKDATACNLNA